MRRGWRWVQAQVQVQVQVQVQAQVQAQGKELNQPGHRGGCRWTQTELLLVSTTNRKTDNGTEG